MSNYIINKLNLSAHLSLRAFYPAGKKRGNPVDGAINTGLLRRPAGRLAMTEKAILKFLINILKSLNLDKLEKFFFALFLLSIPLQTRLTYITPQTYLFGQFNEYATFFIYLSDIFLITTFLLCFVNTLTKHNKFSINLKTFSTSPHIIPILFFLFLWMFITSSFTEFKNIALYQNFKLLEYVLLSIYVAKKLSRFGLTRFASLIFVTGVFQSIIGILQYIDQKSLGLKILGEPDISPKIDNVAKIFIDGERFIRAYGTFPHPNVFAAFLILSIILGFWLILFAKIKQNNKNVSRETFLTEAKEGETILASAQAGETFLDSVKSSQTVWISILTTGILLQFAALIFTFSRIAWFGFILFFIIIIFIVIKLAFQKQNSKIVSRLPAEASTSKNTGHTIQYNQNVSRETFLVSAQAGETILASAEEGETILNCIILNIKHFWNNNLSNIQKRSLTTIGIGFIIIISIFWNQINNRTLDIENNYQQAISYRDLYNNMAIEIINNHTLVGIGGGNFTLIMNKYSPIPLEWWQYQPAHNIYLLITTESGIIGLIIFLIFIFTVLKKAYLKQHNQIVSRLPAEASTSKNTGHTIQYNQNVSRETFLTEAKEGETFLASAQAGETILESAEEGETFLADAEEGEKISVEMKTNKTYWLNNFMLAIFISFLIMALFDHYFWTLQQGRLMFWLTIGILLSFQNQSYLPGKNISNKKQL